jgi:cytochrome c oxidase assembly protein subunit 15
VAILTLLVLLLARQPGSGKLGTRIIVVRQTKLFAVVATLVLFAQIVLGGWTSTNYAALACTDLPTCSGAMVPEMDFANAFHVIRPLGVGPDGELLKVDALRAIHWAHRVGAMAVLVVVGLFAWRLWRTEGCVKLGKMVGVLLALQVLLGLSNVWFSLPIAVAVAHNGIAALLMATMATILYRMNRR